MSVEKEILQMGVAARKAAYELAKLSTEQKNAILEAMAVGLDQEREAIKSANQLDCEAGKKAGLSSAMLDRLELTDARIDGMIAGLRQVISLNDPVGAVIQRGSSA